MGHVSASPGDPLGAGRLLPIGSVVLLEGGDMPLMVFGRAQTAVDDGRFWDYAAVPYPEGNSDREHAYLFDRGQIRKLLFVGYQAEAEEELADRMARVDGREGAGLRRNGTEVARGLSDDRKEEEG